jgi:DNA-binding GntR family transcriptional regulator
MTKAAPGAGLPSLAQSRPSGRSTRAAQTDATRPVFSKAGYAYETLRRSILHGTYQPGERLRLTQLARELNLSEMPVREALRLLQKEGLVVIRLHCGAEVAKLSFQHGLEVTEARVTLEQAAALAAMCHHDAESLSELGRLLDEMEHAASRPVKFALKNRAFCTALFARCPNAFMRQLIEELWDQVWQASSTSIFEVMRHRVWETIDENRAILLHVKKGDARRLQAALDGRMRKTIAAWRSAVAGKQHPSAGVLGQPAPIKVARRRVV